MTRPPIGMLIAVFAIGCQESGTSIRLDAETGDVAVLAFWKDGQSQIALRPFEVGRPFSVDADDDRPIYTYLLKAGAFTDENGTPLSSETVASARLRRSSEAPEPNGCGRCLVATNEAPQPVMPGSACTLAGFTPAALWRKQGDSRTCIGSADGRLCPAGSEADMTAIDEVRQQLVLEWPGDCACRLEDAPSLAGIDFEAIAPVGDPWPIDAWAKGANGDIGGFSRQYTVRATADGQILRERTDGPDIRATLSVGLRDGSFLVVGRRLAPTPSSNEFRFYRYRADADGFADPEEFGEDLVIRPISVRYLEPGGPLYIFGSAPALLSIDAGIVSCDDDLICSNESLTNCPVDPSKIDPNQGRYLTSGAAISRGQRALYVRYANDADRMWNCLQPQSFEWLDPTRTEATPKVGEYVSMGAHGDHAYICAFTEVTDCEQSRPMVLTARIDEDEPTFQIAYLGDAGVSCGPMLELDDGVRLSMSNGRYIDFGPEGAFRSEGRLDDVYGTIDRRNGIRDLGQGTTLEFGQGGRAFVSETNGARRQIYGPSAVPIDFLTATPLPDGRWAAFGENTVRLIDATGATIDIPLSGPALRVTAASVDPNSPRDGPWQILVGGDQGELARLELSATAATIRRLTSPPLPSSRVRDITAVGPLTWVSAGPGPQVLRIEGDQVRSLPIDWDDPGTDAIETAPDIRDECSEQRVTADLFRRIDSRNGIAWIAGYEGLVLRVLPDRVDRFSISQANNASAVHVYCPDEPRIVAQRITSSDEGFFRRRMRAFSLTPSTEDPRQVALTSIGEDEILGIPDELVQQGRPIGVLPDGPWRASGIAGFTFVLANGVLHRMFTGRPAEFIQAPFRPELVVRGTDGSVLFGAPEGRLAIGQPAGP